MNPPVFFSLIIASILLLGVPTARAQSAQINRVLQEVGEIPVIDKTSDAVTPTCQEACASTQDALVKTCCDCHPCLADGSSDPALLDCIQDKGVGHCDTKADQKAPGAAVVGTFKMAPFPPGPAFPCHDLARLAPNLYRCGDYLAFLKGDFPDDLKTMPAHEALTELRNRDLIESLVQSSPNDIVLATVPNDPRFGDQAVLNGSAAADIGAIDAWGALTGDASVVVAVIDSGVDIEHPDLKPNIGQNSGEVPDNGVDDDGNGYVDDVHGFDFAAHSADVSDSVNHGTGVAGVIGAVGNNGLGVAGVNWKVTILPLKFTGAGGSGSLSAAMEAINYAIERGARVINGSWVMDLSAGDPAKVELLRNAIQKAADAGAVFVAAAGNNFGGSGINIDGANVYPAALPVESLIAVAAIDQNGVLAGFSNYGPETVELAAPGVSILTTTPGGDYAGTMGTSIATPFVSGAAALLLSYKPSLTPDEIKSLLTSTARPLSDLSGKVASGGTLDLRAALVSAGANLSSSGDSSAAWAPAPASEGPTIAAAEKTSSSSGKSGGGCSLLTIRPNP